jgi:hypothetical protein
MNALEPPSVQDLSPEILSTRRRDTSVRSKIQNNFCFVCEKACMNDHNMIEHLKSRFHAEKVEEMYAKVSQPGFNSKWGDFCLVHVLANTLARGDVVLIEGSPSISLTQGVVVGSTTRENNTSVFVSLSPVVDDDVVVRGGQLVIRVVDPLPTEVESDRPTPGSISHQKKVPRSKKRKIQESKVEEVESNSDD